MPVPKLLVADKRGRVFDLPQARAFGMAGGVTKALEARDLVPLPFGSRLMVLPGRLPVSENVVTGCSAVAAFVSPGYTVTWNPAYVESDPGVKQLPLFAYAAAAWMNGKFYTAVVRTERERRQDVRLMDTGRIRMNTKLFRKQSPKNRLIRHLTRCALTYCCPAAQNFFLGRYECPLPTARFCNARCLGCISLQPSGCCPVTQPRIDFTPTAQETAEVALIHIASGKNRVASFGQGCEGEPLTNPGLLLETVRRIRKETGQGTLNLNTNASKPKWLERLFEAGLDSMRVSMNSARKTYYDRYFKPRGYAFKDVLTSIRVAGRARKFVSINYFVQPGFTDAVQERDALFRILEKYPANMIQWRNLNFDPMVYFRSLYGRDNWPRNLIGIRELIESVKKAFPDIRHGYFNPPKP